MRLLPRSSIVTPGCRAWNSPRCGASSRPNPDGVASRTRVFWDATISLAACTERSISSSSGNIFSPAAVSTRPSGPLVTRGAPIASSSAVSRRPMVECSTPSERAAPASVLARAAARK